MRRTLLAFASAAVLAAGLAAFVSAESGQAPVQTPDDTQRPVFRGGANLVLVDAYPKKDGKVLEGLTARDFEVFEDGRAQVIENVEFVRIDPSLPETERRDPNNLRDMYAQAADPRNRVFVAFLDAAHVPIEGGVFARRPLVDALNRLVGPGDLFGVATPNQRATDLTLGRKSQTVEDQLARYGMWGQSGRVSTDPNDPVEGVLRDCFEFKHTANGTLPWIVDDGSGRRPFHEVLIERRREDRTFTSLENLVSHLGSMREARSAILPLTRGWALVERRETLASEPLRPPEDHRFSAIPTAGAGLGLARRPQLVADGADERLIAGCRSELARLAALDHPQRLRDLIDRANRNNVSMFPVSVGGLEATNNGAAERVYADDVDLSKGQTVLSRDYARIVGRGQALRTLAEGTGGLAVVDTNDLGGGLARVASELSSYYLLAYSPANTRRDGRYRRIEVRVKVPGTTVRARPGYVPVETLAATGAGTPPPDPAVLAVESALGALGRARATNEIVTTATIGAGEIVTVVELGPGFEAAGWSGGAAVQVDAVGPGGARAGPASALIEPGTRGVVVRLPITAAAGPWRVVAKVTGPRTMQDGIEAVADSGRLLGGAIVYRATPSPRAPLRPVADLLFRRTERLHVEWPVRLPVDATAVRLLDRQGRALPVTLTAVPGTSPVASGAGPVLTVDFNLAPFPEGDYVLEVQATEGPAGERKLQAFRVVR